MRFLVSSWFIRPGISGGWATVADLLLPAHGMAFIGASVSAGMRSCEGVPVTGLSARARMIGRWPALNRMKESLQRRAHARETRAAFTACGADIVLCTDERAALGASDACLPYAIRFHSRPGLLPAGTRDRLAAAALFVTGAQPDFPGVIHLPHSIDLDRFTYSEPARAEAALLTTSLVQAERPDIFVEGVSMSGLRGTVAGDGPLRGEIEEMCRRTGGRVRLIHPVTRLELPGLLSAHQIGVACLEEGWHTTYQMKVVEYQAAGLFPAVQPWSGLAVEAPGLTRTFRTSSELAALLDDLAGNWASTLEVRRRNREYASARHHVRDARRMFEEILASLPRASSESQPACRQPRRGGPQQEADKAVDTGR